MSTQRIRAIAVQIVIVAGWAAALAWIVFALTEQADFPFAYLNGDVRADTGFRFELGVSYPVLIGVFALAALAVLNSLFKARRRLRNLD
ncbi:hypothetical protein AAHB33_05835 [Paenarthrobacter sp. S56]|uniref:hypothetical protein n=1 Tax=Paenarthrobacter sp. S56 TaxID=3138179 RepID=UPI0032192F70